MVRWGFGYSGDDRALPGWFLLTIASSLVVQADAPTALACSCDNPGPAAELAWADAAIVATVVDSELIDSEYTAVLLR